MEGVTINLIGASAGNPKTLTVNRDTASVTNLIDDFVTSFNAFQATAAALGKFDSETGAQGVLLGSASLLNISNQLRRELTDSVIGGNSALRTLSDIGIRTGVDGTLSVDGTILAAALAADPDGVSSLFTSIDGIASNLDRVVEGIVAGDGAIEANITGLNATLNGITDDRAALSLSLISLESRLFAQFNAMDQLVAQLQSTSNFLTQQLTLVESFTVSRRR